MSKVIKVDDGLYFDDGHRVWSDHDQDCCESHWLDFSGLSVEDFTHLEFDLAGDGWFERVEDFGIRLVATNGVAIPVPGYGSNNGYYGDNIDLVLEKFDNPDDRPVSTKRYDVSECQKEQDYY